MTDALLAASVFVVPFFITAAIEQHKIEKERILEEEKRKNFRLGMAYRDECMEQRVLNSEHQQVDKEIERYARMV